MPVVIHLRDRDGSDDAVDGGLRHARGGGGRGRRDPALLLAPGRTGPSAPPSAAGTARSPATSPTRRPRGCARPRGVVPEDRLLVETDSPFLAPQPVRGKPNQPANVVATAERIAEVRGVSYDGARADRRGERRARLRLVAAVTSLDCAVVKGSRERAPGSGAWARTSSPTPTCSTRSSATPALERSRRGARGGRRGRGADRAPRAARSPACTWSRSTSACAPSSSRSRPRPATSTCTGATR